MSEIISRVEIPWYTSGTYDMFDVIKITGFQGEILYFVNSVDNNSSPVGVDEENDRLISNSWKRFDDLSVNFYEIWKPTLQTSSNFDPKVNSEQYNEGHVSRYSNELNSVQNNIEMFFNDIEEKEAISLLAFLEFVKWGYAFKFYLPEPFNKESLFNLETYSIDMNEYGKYSITVIVNENRNPYIDKMGDLEYNIPIGEALMPRYLLMFEQDED